MKPMAARPASNTPHSHTGLLSATGPAGTATDAGAAGAEAATTGFGNTTDAVSCGKASLLLRVGISCDKGIAACAVRGSPHASR